MRLRIQLTCLTVALLALLAAFPAAAQCDNGREGILSDTFLGTSAVEWRMLVEHKAVTLTVSAPCGLVIDRTYKEGESPFFSLKEIPAADPDGVYSWQLRITPHVDPEVEKMLKSARESGDDQTIEYELRQKNALPAGPFLQTGAFTVLNGGIVPQGEEERQSSSKLTAGVRPAASPEACPHDQAAPAVQTARLASIAPAVDRGGSTRPPALAAAETPRRVTEETVITGDLTVYNSLCVGFDCATSETYGADTIRLKENNLRIHFDDTSTASSFPRNDWRIEINSQTNGGGNYFRINDVTGARSPFTIEAGAPSHSLYVDNTGRIGRRTANPILDLHIVDGDTPGIRLDQDGSSGFGAQVWDIAGNESNFFVRDATGGSTLPFRIFPGSPSNSLVVRNGDVGVGVASPQDKLHVRTTADPTNGQFFLENTSGTAALRTMINMQNNGGVRWQVNDRFQVRFNNNQFQFDNTTNPGNECVISSVGDLTCLGVKNFATIDPEDSRRAIYYAALEGPEAGTYHRGTVRLTDGEAIIELPRHFAKVTEAEGMTVQLTPLGEWAQLYVVEKTPQRVVVRLAGEARDLEIDYMVYGVRRGYLDYQVERSSADLISDIDAH